jgi:hypothetical protein
MKPATLKKNGIATAVALVIGDQIKIFSSRYVIRSLSRK